MRKTKKNETWWYVNRCNATKSKCIAGFQSLLQLVSAAFLGGLCSTTECERKVRVRSRETQSRKERARWGLGGCKGAVSITASEPAGSSHRCFLLFCFPVGGPSLLLRFLKGSTHFILLNHQSIHTLSTFYTLKMKYARKGWR